MPTAFALGRPALVAEGAPVDPVNARTATRPIRTDSRPDTRCRLLATAVANATRDRKRDRVRIK
jgi:hypothetical protein